MKSFVGIIILAVILILLILGVRAIYISFFKKKDERSRWVVQSSMAQSFVIVCILQFIVAAAKWFAPIWWQNFKEGLYVDPVIVSFMVLGLLLVINTKRHGGSL